MNITKHAAPVAFFGSLAFNYYQHKNDRPTVCSDLLRPLLHTETKTGKVLTYAVWASITVWFMPHLTLDKNQNHVRA